MLKCFFVPKYFPNDFSSAVLHNKAEKAVFSYQYNFHYFHEFNSVFSELLLLGKTKSHLAHKIFAVECLLFSRRFNKAKWLPTVLIVI